jgi:alkylhydroperoxidase/carboxymuconolactone decarboxylase family protein YurZ
MATVKLWTDEEVSANPRIRAVFDEIRSTRKSDFVNNFWRALANQPALLERTWSSVKEVMIEPGTLDPLTKELIYIAVSTMNSCSYCMPSFSR